MNKSIWISGCGLIALMWICPTVAIILVGAPIPVYLASMFGTVIVIYGVCNYGG